VASKNPPILGSPFRSALSGGAVLASVALAVAWWVLDAAADSVLFAEGTFAEELLSPSHRELVLRLSVAIAILVIAVTHLRMRGVDRQLEMFAAAVENAGDAAFWKDRSGRLVYVNEAACQMLGYSREELLTMSLADVDPFVTPDDVERSFAELAGKKRYRLERFHRAKSGRLIPVELSGTYVKLGAGLYTCSFIRDMTERNAVRDALERSQETLLRAQRVARLGSFEWDVRTNASQWSDEMYRLLGAERRAFEATNEAFFEFIHPEDRDRVRERIARDVAERSPHLSVHRVVQASGTVIWVRCQGELLLGSDGEPSRMVGTIQDVTDIKRAEEELRERNRLKDLFTDVMRHDLMNPAAGIRLASEALLRVEQDAAKSGLLRGIRRGADDMIGLCEAATKYAKIADVTQVDMREHDLGSILVETVAAFRAELEQRRASIRFEPDRPFPAQVSPLIADVFANLISNAVKYGPEGSGIEVTVRDEGERWRVVVADRGPGIPDEDKPRVFGRFERLEPLRARGAGLGLAIARQIVDLHRGRIWVEDNPGGGSAFCVEVAKAAPA
jgi:PAS domain S-box-containing protein